LDSVAHFQGGLAHSVLWTTIQIFIETPWHTQPEAMINQFSRLLYMNLSWQPQLTIYLSHVQSYSNRTFTIIIWISVIRTKTVGLFLQSSHIKWGSVNQICKEILPGEETDRQASSHLRWQQKFISYMLYICK
jgi:hypothetical protein